MRSFWVGLLLAACVASGCGPASVRPVSFPDTEVACPGGHLTWGLQIEDQRVKREAESRMIAAVKDAVQKSFPGCRWDATDADAGTIAIEVHRFGSHLDSGYWEAAVEWSVSARNASGSVLTEFEVNEEVSRPNYQGSDNEKESLSEAFRKGVERTTRGLTSLSTSEGFRHPEGTVAVLAPEREREIGMPSNPQRPRVSLNARPRITDVETLERISQPRTSEDL
jgi:hypothetical protein